VARSRHQRIRALGDIPGAGATKSDQFAALTPRSGVGDHDREEFSSLWNELFTLKKMFSGSWS
jgi:hypothetical protein